LPFCKRTMDIKITETSTWSEIKKTRNIVTSL
jgi:hypothetical protein